MGLAKHKKLSKFEYDSLSTKDEDTIYAVNESGDFSEENLDDTAELFIGDKKIANDIPYGECNVSPSTVEKLVTTLNGNFKLKQGAEISVKFYQDHTAPAMTLNVDGTGAKNVYRDGHSLKDNMIRGYNVYKFVYDGTYWRIIGVDTNTTYSLATTSSQGLMSSADKTKLDSMTTGAGYEAYLQWGGGNRYNDYSPIDASMIPMLGSNRFNCYPVNKVNIEYSRDKGVTWVDYGATEEEKQALFKEDLNATIQVGGKEATPSIDNMVRITIDTASLLYAKLNKFIFYVSNSSGSNDCHVTISGRTQQNYENDNDTWSIFADKVKVLGWSGWNVVNTNYLVTYGNTKTTQYGQIRFTFGLDSLLNSQNIGLIVLKMSAYGQAYTAPNILAWYGRPFQYNYDSSIMLNKPIISWGSLNTTFDKNTETLPTGISVWNALGSNNCDAPSEYSVIFNVKGHYMMQLAANVIDNTLNFRNSFSRNWEKVFTNNSSLIPNGNNIYNIGNSSNRWANIYASNIYGALKGNADSATKVNNALTIKKGSTTDIFDGSTTKTIDITDLQNIGDLNNLQTSNKSNLVDAINEVNIKANNNTGGTVNDSTISPFAGFLPDGATIIDSSSSSTNGEVLYASATNRFIWKDLSGTIVQYYANWGTSYLYNTTSDSSTSAKVDKLFSYNDKHYMVINGTLQDISALNDIASSTVSGIVKLSDSTTGSNYGSDRGVAATPKAVASVATAARNYTNTTASQTLESSNQYTDSKATQVLTSANNYTDNQISAKIQLVTALPSNPISDVLYLIQET